jgi:hypothetical protein
MTVLASGEVFWKYIYVLLCVILLCLTAGQLFIGLSDVFHGFDYRVLAAAVQATNNGQDPYLLPNIQQYTYNTIPYNYAPHTLFILWCLQYLYIFQNIWEYYVILVALMVASGYFIVNLDQKPQYLFIITLMMTGFMTTFWNFYNGNKEIVFLFLFAGIFYLMLKEKFWQSAIVLGITGSFTLVHLPFIALSLVINRPILQRIQYFLLSISVVLVIFLISWLINPSLFVSYINSFQGSSSAVNEPSGIYLLTPVLMFGVLLHQTNGISVPMILISLIYFVFIFGTSWFVIKKHQENPLIVYSLAMFAIFMLLPRIKPYFFIILVIPLYFLFKDCNDKIKILVLTVVSLLPIGVWYHFLLDHTQPISYLTFLFHEYSQTFSLLLIFAIALLVVYYKPVSSPSSQA